MVSDQFASVNARLDNLETEVLRIENDHGEKLQALIDAYEAPRDVNERVDNAVQRIGRLEMQVSEH